MQHTHPGAAACMALHGANACACSIVVDKHAHAPDHCKRGEAGSALQGTAAWMLGMIALADHIARTTRPA